MREGGGSYPHGPSREAASCGVPWWRRDCCGFGDSGFRSGMPRVAQRSFRTADTEAPRNEAGAGWVAAVGPGHDAHPTTVGTLGPAITGGRLLGPAMALTGWV